MTEVPRELWDRVNENRGLIIQLKTNQTMLVKSVDKIDQKLEYIDDKITKSIINGAVNKAVQNGKDKMQNYKIGVWGWFIRLMTAAAMTALIGGTVSRILGYWR